MIKKLFLAIIALTLFSTPSYAGRLKPIYNVTNAYVLTSSGQTPTLEQVQEAFEKAAEEKGWYLQYIEPGHIVASIIVRNHFAQVDVNFTPKNYSITYKTSRELRYNGTHIHRNYNKWIILLEKRFTQNLLLY